MCIDNCNGDGSAIDVSHIAPSSSAILQWHPTGELAPLAGNLNEPTPSIHRMVMEAIFFADFLEFS